MKTATIILTLFTFSTFLRVNGQNDLGQIPVRIKQVADSVILSTIGTDYSKVTSLDCDKSLIHVSNPSHLVFNNCQTVKPKNRKARKRKANNLTPDFYILRYQLTLKANSIYRFEIRVNTNLKLKDKISLPDCKNLNSCNIEVDSLTAIDLSINSGLEKGLGIKSKLIYDDAAKAFQWEVQNQSDTKPDRGDTIYIDALTGQRISSKDSQWVKHLVR